MRDMSAPTSKFDRSLIEGPIASAIWKIAWPTMLMNLVSGLQGLVDHIMVGHYVGFEGNAAIGVSWQIFLVVVVFIGSLFAGMGVLVARFAGAGDSEKVDRVVFQVVSASTLIGIFIIAPLGYFVSPHLLGWVNAAPEVQAEALPYLRILFVFSLGMMYFFLIAGGLRAAGDARTPMRLGIVVTVLNVVLNVILIGGLGPIPALGTTGAAIGTVAANLLVAGYALWRLTGGGWVIHLRPVGGWKPDFEVLRSVLRFGLPTGFQGIVMNLGGVLLLRFVGSLEQSAAAQAAYAVCYTQLFSLISWTANGLMAAAATVTGQNLGAGRPERAERAPLLCSATGLVFAAPMALAFLFAPRLLLGLFGLEDPDVLFLGRQLLAYLSVSAFLVTMALSYTGSLQGSGDTKSPFYISLVSQLVLPLGLCAALDLYHGLRPSEIWSAIVLGHLVRFVLSVGRFRQGKWRGIEVALGSAR